MRFQTSDPDLATIIRRIERGTIDLQPNFQRGEVWTTPKKQRLIDTILRRWHVPPVHLVAKGGGRFDVLDGQQRLTSIRDFVAGIYTVDGRIKPTDRTLEGLHGLRYAQLPNETRDEFDTFAIRVFELHDYSPAEPHELFFRLNQPVTLTEAEKRNAFIGEARNQVKDLVEWAQERGMTSDRLGFSNARMAYDDLLARFLLTVEQRRLTGKVTSLRITSRYRDEVPFSDEVVERATESLQFFLDLPLLDKDQQRIKSNKATVHTWLCMAAKLSHEGALHRLGDDLHRTIATIERWRLTRVPPEGLDQTGPLSVFHDRATARVADVSSVVLRDLTAWMVLHRVGTARSKQVPAFIRQTEMAWHELDKTREPERSLTNFASLVGWGEAAWL